MGKRKHKTSDTIIETIEDKVLNKYHKYKKDNHLDVKDNEQTNDEHKLDETQTHDNITQTDINSAEDIFKKCKKIKDEATKEAIKLRKKAKKLAKQQPTSDSCVDQNNSSEDNSKTGKCLTSVQYLKDWKYRPDFWKFKKNLQIWLLKNWKYNQKLSDKDFDLFLEYIFSANSHSLAKKRLEEEAKAIVDKESVTEETVDKEKVVSSDTTVDEIIVDRARRVLQCL
ncbi:uncharacterized protein C7orf50 homolog [Oppia nitens]|uniref:uncharacterized protein C7orf50 homolog n=1 Tax=Oppia nitens TaxID=1686743 RepID=UPI0023DCD912|nr:uncharacterized protein C7orf50 homolog [Oppia nitens]